YQWYFNTNTPLPLQTNATCTFTNAQPSDAGTYQVIVSNFVGSVTSSLVTLTVLPPAPPSITTQPAGRAVIAGQSATLTVVAAGYAPLRYQWFLNSSNALAGQTNTTLSFSPASLPDTGSYSVIITNSVGAITSSPAVLTVIDVGPANLPAFSGADGAAKFVSGGRGGLVYHVTKLDRNFSDAASGTLRYGLTDGNFPTGLPRTIVFDVAGTFWLGRYGAESNHVHGWDTSSRFNIPSNVTLAGQTAPGPVIIAGGTTKPSASNIILRNVTLAPSYGTRSFQEDFSVLPTPGDFPDSYVFDALDISGQNIMLDHLTTVYGTDETISCNELAANLTIQYCTIAQGENYPQADAENPGVYTGHALGSLLQAGSNAKISILNNLYAHLKGRLPRVGSEIGTGALNDFRNNVFYNWLGTAGSGASPQPSSNNFVANFYLAGPGGDDASGTNIVTSSGGTGIFSGSSATYTRAFVSGNLADLNKDGDPNDDAAADASYSSITSLGAAIPVNIGVTLSARSAFTNTLRYSGARWWVRPYDFTLGNTAAITTNDMAAYVDERLVKETATGTGKIIAWADDPFNTSPSEGWEWRGLLALRADPVTGNAQLTRAANWDTDGDGLPDDWEIAHGLNPNAANNNADFDSDGYTDLEEYLNDIAAWPASSTVNFTGATNNRYAQIFNWRVNGQPLNISGLGSIVTSSEWQPSRFDTVLISNQTVIVDAAGQNAGTLRLTNNAVLNLTNGWLSVANRLENNAGCVLAVTSSGSLRVTNSLVNRGTLRLTGNAGLTVGGTFTNTGTLDVMSWSGTLPTGLVNTGTILDRSLVVITSHSLAGANFTVTLQGYLGHTYQLQYRDDFTSGSWQNVGTAAAGAGVPLPLVHANGANTSMRYYRVMIDP
ncbi:MAG: immunoglobulin domain-containing protein, partial [Verrucomicrobiota bacterium]